MPTRMKKIIAALFALCVITPALAQSDVGNWPSQRPIKTLRFSLRVARWIKWHGY